MVFGRPGIRLISLASFEREGSWPAVTASVIDPLSTTPKARRAVVAASIRKRRSEADKASCDARDIHRSLQVVQSVTDLPGVLGITITNEEATVLQVSQDFGNCRLTLSELGRDRLLQEWPFS